MPDRKPIRALIADDEAAARRGLRYLIEKEGDLTIVEECETGRETLLAIERSTPDVAFLDIQMPELDGLSLLEALRMERLPLIVFVTAFDDYAVAAFQAAALDYLTKPIAESRFHATVARVRERLRERDSTAAHDDLRAFLAAHRSREHHLDRLVVRSGERIDVIPVAEVDWIEAAGDFACLHVGKRSHVLSEALTALEERLDPRRFLRVHRSRIVNVDRIRSMHRMFHGEYVLLLEDGTRITSGRRYGARLKEFFSNT